MDDSTHNFRLEQDAEKGTLALKDLADPTKSYTLRYTSPDADHLTLEGQFMDAAISVRLRRVDVSSLPLMSRGFHWINEAPYNK